MWLLLSMLACDVTTTDQVDSGGGQNDTDVDDTDTDADTDTDTDSDTDTDADTDTDSDADTDTDTDSDTDTDTDSDSGVVESCNGLDDDGDGDVDEGFPDADIDGIADCVDGPYSYVEEWTDLSGTDVGASTGEVSVDEGRIYLWGPRVLAPVGDGSEGDWTGAVDSSFAPGDHSLTTIGLTGGTHTIAGDTVLRVSGTASLKDAVIQVDGNLDLYVGDALILDCASLEVTGQLTVHAAGAAGVTLACASGGGSHLRTYHRTDTDYGELILYSVGPIQLADGYIVADLRWSSEAWPASGDLEIWSYGDLTLEGNSHIQTERSWTMGGNVYVATLGSVALSGVSTVGSLRPALPGKGALTLRVAGSLSAADSAVFESNSGAPLDAIVEGDVLLTGNGTLRTALGVDTAPGDLSLRAGALSMDRGHLYAADADRGPYAHGGDVTIGVAGDISLGAFSVLGAGGGQCDRGGDVSLQAGGSLTLAADAKVYAGDAWEDVFFPYDPCTMTRGGNVSAAVNGDLLPNADAAQVPTAGPGSPPGNVSITEHSKIATPVVDAALLERTELLGLPRSVPPGLNVVSRAELQPNSYSTGSAQAWLIPGAGQAEVPFKDAVGTELSDGWSWRVELEARFFDEASVDALIVEWE